MKKNIVRGAVNYLSAKPAIFPNASVAKYNSLGQLVSLQWLPVYSMPAGTPGAGNYEENKWLKSKIFIEISFI